MTTAEFTEKVKTALAVLCGVIESVTVTVTVSVSTVPGVPEITPVTGLSVNCPPVFGVMTALHVNGYVPPASVNWKL